MGIWQKIKKIFKRTDALRECIENKIATVLESASNNDLLDKGQELILSASIDAIKLYIEEKTGQDINLSSKTKQSIIKGIVEGNNKLQKKVAGVLRK